jgi:hypothetical protein
MSKQMSSIVGSRASRVFDRYIGIDYSGAQTPTSSLKGLRVYQAPRGCEATEVPPPPSPRSIGRVRAWRNGLLQRSKAV